MSRRRYTYSYSPSPRRDRRVRQNTSAHRGWLLLLAVFALVGAVLARQLVAGDDGSAAARSNCWTQVACSAERVESKSENSAGPASGTDGQHEKEPPPAISAAAVAGLKDTHFVNPHGLDAADHYTSAYDIAVLGNLLLQKPDLAFIVGTRTYQPNWDGPRVDNLNQLLGQYPGAIGVKTGYTLTAGHTIVAAAERNGRRFIVSVLGSGDNFGDATKLLDWAFTSAPSSCAKAGTSQVAAR